MSRNNKATRRSTTCGIIGPPSDLPSAELPTLKQVLQKCLKTKQSSSHYNLPANEIAIPVSKDLIKLWQKVHPDIPLHQPNSIRIKVKASYEEYTLVKRNKHKLKHFIEHLDKLYDICSCKCKFISHSDTCDQNCTRIHIDCKCDRERKIPVSELSFIKDQRDKVGPTGKYQLGLVDSVHVKKRKRAQSRKFRSKKNAKCVASEPVTESFDSDRVTSTSSEGSAEYNADATYEPDVFQSDHIDLENVAREADRYNLSDRSVASLLTAHLIDRKIITQKNTSAAVTRKMVRAARMKYRSNVEVLTDEPLTAVYVDEKKDDTCTKTVDESGKTRYSKVKEGHCVLTSEPDGTYISHFAPENGMQL